MFRNVPAEFPGCRPRFFDRTNDFIFIEYNDPSVSLSNLFEFGVDGHGE